MQGTQKIWSCFTKMSISQLPLGVSRSPISTFFRLANGQLPFLMKNFDFVLKILSYGPKCKSGRFFFEAKYPKRASEFWTFQASNLSNITYINRKSPQNPVSTLIFGPEMTKNARKWVFPRFPSFLKPQTPPLGVRWPPRPPKISHSTLCGQFQLFTDLKNSIQGLSQAILTQKSDLQVLRLSPSKFTTYDDL